MLTNINQLTHTFLYECRTIVHSFHITYACSFQERRYRTLIFCLHHLVLQPIMLMCHFYITYATCFSLRYFTYMFLYMHNLGKNIYKKKKEKAKQMTMQVTLSTIQVTLFTPQVEYMIVIVKEAMWLHGLVENLMLETSFVFLIK